MERDFADRLEPHSEIEFDCFTIGAAYVEPRHKVVPTLVSYKLPNEARSETSATK